MTRSTKAGTASAEPHRRIRWRRAAVWSGTTLAGYAMTLSVASDTVYLLAVPGTLCLLTVVIVGVHRVQRGRVDLPSDADLHRRLRLHRAVVLRRYGSLMALAAVLCAAPLVADVMVLYPLVGIGLGVAKVVHYFLFGQLSLLRAQARVLSVYEPEFRDPVRIVLGLGHGRLCLRVGEGQRRSPRMVALVGAVVGDEPGITGGGWFAGDDELGGVLATPGGALLLLVPQDGKERARHRSRADAERKARERRAGLDRLHP